MIQRKAKKTVRAIKRRNAKKAKSKAKAARTLCASFQRLSECIWDDLEAATRATLQRDEETITNDLLLDLWRLHPSDVIIVQFNKPQEARTGADWLWTLTDGTTWFSMLVQAKRLYQKTERYEKLGHSVGNPPRHSN
jgi:hypothetical protein